MAIAYGSEVTIDRLPTDVFPYLVERDKQRQWSDVAMTRLTAGDMRTGSRFEVSFGMGPVKATVGIELTQVEPGSPMTWKSFSGPISWHGEYRLEPVGAAATRLSQQGTLECSRAVIVVMAGAAQRRAAVAAARSVRNKR